ncbi:MAG: hypothetical protein IK045_07320 [Bacteroidales bacterium]|nr:hypothetical protein [Bacteroidales bacterium]
MKRIASFVAAFAVLFAIFSCNREQAPDYSVTASVKGLSFPGDGGNETFTIETSGTWATESTVSWMKVSPSFGRGPATISVEVKKNKGDKERTGRIFVTNMAGNKQGRLIIPVAQGGNGEGSPDVPDDPNVPDDVEEGEVTTFTIAGSWGWDTGDKPTVKCGNFVVARNLHLTPDDKFKIRRNKSWTYNWGAGLPGENIVTPALDTKVLMGLSGKNMSVATEGNYDIYFSPHALILYIETAGAEWTHDAEGDEDPEELSADEEDKPVPEEPGELSQWTLVGNWDPDWKTDIDMYEYGNFVVAQGVTFASGVEFKLRKSHDWHEGSFGAGPYVEGTKTTVQADTRINLNVEGNNISIAAGTYDVYFSEAARILYIEPAGAEWTHNSEGVASERAPDESPWTIVGDHCNWTVDAGTRMTVEGHWHIARDVFLTRTAFGSGDAGFKFVYNASWNINLGCGDYVDHGVTIVDIDTKANLQSGGNNIVVAQDGNYDVYLAPENNIAYIIRTGEEFTHTSEGKAGFNLGGSVVGNFPAERLSGLTYQVLVYSFADSNGDGWGDFKGIQEHLDYFVQLGCTALWLSPIHPSQSYHGYDVTDFTKVNPKFGTMTDFTNMVNAAHEKGIKIYLDYVINHTGNEHFWFTDCKNKGSESPYWSYYSFSQNPQSDISAGRIPQCPSGTYGSGQWFPVTVKAGGVVRYRLDLDWTNASAPKLTAQRTTAEVTTGGGSGFYLWWGDSKCTEFLPNGTNKYYMVLDFASDWGCIIREGENGSTWTPGKKWGVQTEGDQLVEGVPKTLYHNAEDNNAVYNLIMPVGEKWMYHSSQYTGVFADLNYGPIGSCENSAAFKAIVSSAKGWIDDGVDGFRLDAVKHIYNNETDENLNPVFWQKFYNAVNTYYKSKGHTDNIYMVGENLSWAGEVKTYYKGLPSLFDFSFWWDLRDALNSGNGSGLPGSLAEHIGWYKGYRSDAIDAIKLSNHDEDRTASALGNYKPKIATAACVLLTVPGKPFIYQGEELGYWGVKSNSDEYIRTPIMWNANGKGMAAKGVNSKIDKTMLTSEISVEVQAAEENSLLWLYRTFAAARNSNPALADGWLEYDSANTDGRIASWYMHANSGDKVCLVIHNFSGASITVDRSAHGNNLSNILVSNGAVSVSSSSVTMPAYSSVVFALN